MNSTTKSYRVLLQSGNIKQPILAFAESESQAKEQATFGTRSIWPDAVVLECREIHVEL